MTDTKACWRDMTDTSRDEQTELKMLAQLEMISREAYRVGRARGVWEAAMAVDPDCVKDQDIPPSEDGYLDRIKTAIMERQL